MNNIPEVRIGVVAVSRDCFPESLSVDRRKALMAAFAEKYGQEAASVYECPICIVESEIHMVQALEDIKKNGCNALVVYLGNFGPEMAALTMASAASTAPTRPLVSIMPKALVEVMLVSLMFFCVCHGNIRAGVDRPEAMLHNFLQFRDNQRGNGGDVDGGIARCVRTGRRGGAATLRRFGMAVMMPAHAVAQIVGHAPDVQQVHGGHVVGRGTAAHRSATQR